MLVTLSGMLMLVSDSHQENASSPMLVTLSGMLMLVKEWHLANASSPMLVTLFGMLRLVREWHSEKAFFPILFMLLGMLYVSLTPIYAIMIVLSSLNKVSFSYTNDLDSLCRVPCLSMYLQPIITQYFIDNKSEIWLLFLIAHSKR